MLSIHHPIFQSYFLQTSDYYPKAHPTYQDNTQKFYHRYHFLLDHIIDE
jgi:hypothetical protein